MEHSAFIEAIRNVVFTAIRSIEITETLVLPHSWDNSSSRVLSSLMYGETVSYDEISQAVHLQLKKIGRKNCEGHRLSKILPDHTTSPHAFAYALLHNEFTDGEVSRIKFGDGEDKEKFIRIYANGLKENIIEQLLTERKEPVSTDTNVSDCICCC